MSKKALRLSVDYNTDDPQNTVVLFKLLNDKDEVIDTREYNTDEIHESLRGDVEGYGLNKFLTDRTSGQKDKLIKLEEMDAYMQMLRDGIWQKDRVVGAPVTSPAVEALAELQGITVPQAQAALAAYPKDQREKILANPKVTELAKTIKERREAQEVASLDDLLAS